VQIRAIVHQHNNWDFSQPCLICWLIQPCVAGVDQFSKRFAN
jgi:hypothetical protein